MIVAGCDIGSLTAKAVVIDDSQVVARKVMRVKATPVKSANAVMGDVLGSLNLSLKDVDYCCSTGYGRFKIPFSNMNMSEISCHALGANWVDSDIRTVIDIGGQDCKVISINGKGFVDDFIMNEKCAAGTGRSLELLSRTIGVGLEELGSLAIKSKKEISISNKCSIFMELDVLQHLYKKQKKKDIAAAICTGVAKRVVQLTKAIPMQKDICLSGGVSMNIGVKKRLEEYIGMEFKVLPDNPQLMGAIGAAVYALNAYKEGKRKG